MIDLFADGDLVATRTHTTYEFTAGGRVVARTRNRPVAAAHWWSHVLRLLWSRNATRHIEIDVLDASDVPRWGITLAPGDPQLLADYADVLAMVNGRSLAGRPTALVLEALKADPKHQKALALAGTAAFNSGDFAKAADWWKQLLATLPTGSDQA
jgi:hypothetical protein